MENVYETPATRRESLAMSAPQDPQDPPYPFPGPPFPPPDPDAPPDPDDDEPLPVPLPSLIAVGNSSLDSALTGCRNSR